MATTQDVLDALAKYKADVIAKLNELQAKIDAGGTVESADLDKIKAEIDADDAELNPAPAEPVA